MVRFNEKNCEWCMIDVIDILSFFFKIHESVR